MYQEYIVQSNEIIHLYYTRGIQYDLLKNGNLVYEWYIVFVYTWYIAKMILEKILKTAKSFLKNRKDGSKFSKK